MQNGPSSISESARNLAPNFYKIYSRRLVLFSVYSLILCASVGIIAYLCLKEKYAQDFTTLAHQNLLFLQLGLIFSTLFISLLSAVIYWIVLRNKYIRYEGQRLLLRSEKIIELNSKMAELGQLSATLIHEINNPLGILDLALHQLKKNPQVKDGPLIQSSLVAIERMKKLVKSVKSYSYDSPAQCLKEYNFADSLQETLVLLDQTLRTKGIRCLGNVERDIFFKGDPSKMGQVLINLIINARDAIEELDHSERWIKVETLKSSDNFAKILISNGGPKIRAEVAQQMFEPYFTTKERGRGTGLGLSTCLKILEPMGLTLQLDHSFEHTTFVISGQSVQCGAQAINSTFHTTAPHHGADQS